MKLKLLDIAAALLILASSAILAIPSIMPSQAAHTFTVESGGMVSDYSLSKNGKYTVMSNGYTIVITVKDGSVTVTEADCPDGLCKAMPNISNPGEAIVCLPAKTVIRIYGKEADVDGIAG